MRTRAAATRPLALRLILYGIATLVHFVHNAHYLADYPNLPAAWTPAEVYAAWLGMSALGVAGWLALRRGAALPGLALLALYAVLGLDSLGHYWHAPLGRHTGAMNATILAEVIAAALVLIEVVRLALRHGLHRSKPLGT